MARGGAHHELPGRNANQRNLETLGIQGAFGVGPLPCAGLRRIKRPACGFEVGIADGSQRLRSKRLHGCLRIRWKLLVVFRDARVGFPHLRPVRLKRFGVAPFDR